MSDPLIPQPNMPEEQPQNQTMEDILVTVDKHLGEGNQNTEHLLEQGARMEQTAEHTLEATSRVADSIKKLTETLTPKTEAEGEIRVIKGPRGDKGEKGDTPSNEKVVELIKPLLTEEIKKLTPTDDKLTNLIESLIPEPIPGEKGEVGIQGPQGEIGPMGPEGAQGPQGIPGKDGKNGKDGNKITLESLIKILKGKFSYDDLTDLPNLQAYISQIRDSHTGGGPGYIYEISDVDTTGLVPSQVLVWNGVKWRPGAGGAAPTGQVYGETPSGTMDGVNTIFTLAHTPDPAASLRLYLNGARQQAGGGDYTLVGATITFVNAPLGGGVLLADYVY